MSTPISNIPIQSQSPTEEDPEVLALLKELQPPVADSTMSASVPSSPPMSPPMPIPASSYYNVHESFGSSRKPYFQPEVMQKTLIFVILAFILFYPRIFDSVYQKIPSLDAFRTYEVVGRALLLFVITYGLQWKFLDV